MLYDIQKDSLADQQSIIYRHFQVKDKSTSRSESFNSYSHFRLEKVGQLTVEQLIKSVRLVHLSANFFAVQLRLHSTVTKYAAFSVYT